MYILFTKNKLTSKPIVRRLKEENFSIRMRVIDKRRTERQAERMKFIVPAYTKEERGADRQTDRQADRQTEHE
jgi:hypothetical protein